MGLVWTKHLQVFADEIEKKVEKVYARITDIPKTLPASGGNADTVNNHMVEADVPQGAKFTDTQYATMKGASASASGIEGLVPAPDMGNQNSFLRGDGVWAEMEELSDADIKAIIAGTYKES